MVSVLVTILMIVVIGAAICGIIYAAPFIPTDFKKWALYATSAVIAVLIVLQLVTLLQGAVA